MQNTFFSPINSGESNGYSDCREGYEATGYRNSITENKPTDKTEAWYQEPPTYPVHYTNTYADPSNGANNIDEYFMQEQTMQPKEMVPTPMYKNATADDEYVENGTCTYLREKGNSLISKQWVPHNPKVFVRRVDGLKHPSKEAVYKVVNGNYNDEEKPMPYDPHSRDVFVKQKLEEFSNVPCEYIGASTKRIISPDESEVLLSNADNNEEVLKDFCVLSNYQTYNSVPLCVQETSQLHEKQTDAEFPIQPLIQDDYYFRHVMARASQEGCVLTPDKLLKLVNFIFNFLCKTMKLVFRKIKTHLDTSEAPIVFLHNSLPNMDVACDVCERTEEQRISDANRGTDFLSHFESIQTHSGILQRLIDLLDAFGRSDSTPVPRIQMNKEPVEPRAYYQARAFPKDKNGKVLLPKFEENN